MAKKSPKAKVREEVAEICDVVEDQVWNRLAKTNAQIGSLLGEEGMGALEEGLLVCDQIRNEELPFSRETVERTISLLEESEKVVSELSTDISRAESTLRDRIRFLKTVRKSMER